MGRCCGRRSSSSSSDSSGSSWSSSCFGWRPKDIRQNNFKIFFFFKTIIFIFYFVTGTIAPGAFVLTRARAACSSRLTIFWQCVCAMISARQTKTLKDFILLISQFIRRLLVELFFLVLLLIFSVLIYF